MKNWDDVRYYLAIARSSSVSGAARELCVSHATVLRRISLLEEEMGIKLFKRLQGGYQLSEAGRDLFETAVEVEAGMQKMYSRASSIEAAGPLRITQPYVGFSNIYSIYADFLSQYPDITLEILPGFWDYNINQQEADVALFAGERPHELLVGRELGAIHWRIYGSRRYLAQFDGEPMLAELNWLMIDKALLNLSRAGTVSIWDMLYKHVEKPRVVMQSRSYADLMFAVKEGLGVTFMSDAFAHNFDDIERVPGCEMVSATRLWLLTNRDLRHVPRVRAFMAFVGDKLEEQLAAAL
jgi:DNA-binding transcriptional LysR family regulator